MFQRAGYYGRGAPPVDPLAPDVFDLNFATGSDATAVTAAGFALALSGTNYSEIGAALTNTLEISSAWGLVVNGAHTNLADNCDGLSAWTLTNVTATANVTGAAPDGSNSADRFTETTANGNHAVVQPAANTITNAANYVWSIAVKPETVDRIKLYAVAGTNEASFLLTGAGSLISQTGTARTFIHELGGGWYRCGFIWVSSGTSVTPGVRLLNASNADSYTGSTSNTLLLHRAGLELQPYSPPAVTTAAASVNVPSGTCIANRATVTQGTVLIKGRSPIANASVGHVYCLDNNNATATRIALQMLNTGSGAMQMLVQEGGTTLVNLALPSALAFNTDYKLIIRFGAADYAVRTSWGAAVSNTSAAIPTGMVRERLGSQFGSTQQYFGRFWRVARWSAKLSDADMQTVLDAA